MSGYGGYHLFIHLFCQGQNSGALHTLCKHSTAEFHPSSALCFNYMPVYAVNET